jgi:hypothetical protein
MELELRFTGVAVPKLFDCTATLEGVDRFRFKGDGELPLLLLLKGDESALLKMTPEVSEESFVCIDAVVDFFVSCMARNLSRVTGFPPRLPSGALFCFLSLEMNGLVVTFEADDGTAVFNGVVVSDGQGTSLLRGLCCGLGCNFVFSQIGVE